MRRRRSVGARLSLVLLQVLAILGNVAVLGNVAGAMPRSGSPISGILKVPDAPAFGVEGIVASAKRPRRHALSMHGSGGPTRPEDVVVLGVKVRTCVVCANTKVTRGMPSELPPDPPPQRPGSEPSPTRLWHLLFCTACARKVQKQFEAGNPSLLDSQGEKIGMHGELQRLAPLMLRLTGRCTECPRVASYGHPTGSLTRASRRLAGDVCFSFKLCGQVGWKDM
ncbi:hypothetical protein T484DRAFT_1789494 [Baffinella frigidus]|nr:hypothetical protein T484DRAFT_1789494 [Cryptophyta sp. CCMP2293]